MCAECHSTGVSKNYDAAKDTFATTWAEISVGCETCHGQGSAHVAWAGAHPGWRPDGKDNSKGLIVRFDERANAAWTIDPATGNAGRGAAPATLRKEVETCGFCHARRGTIAENWVPGQWLSDTHVIPPLSHGLYFADGQMEDEVYNYGSFKQSRMFAKGVTCSDCHDPHSAKLKAPGDGVCLQCHASDKYAVAAHSRHGGVDPPVGCPACHMPTRTYMVVDPRHDHSLRIPRPDLSVRLGTPNACNACHADKTPQWAADTIESWHGPTRKGFQHYAEAFHDAWSERGDAGALLAAAASDRSDAGLRPRRRARRACALPVRVQCRARCVGPRRSRSHGAGSARSTCWAAPSRTRSGRWPRRCSAIRCAAFASGPPICWPRFRPPASQPPTGRLSSARPQEFVAAQRLNADRPEGAAHARKLLRPHRRDRGRRGRIQGGAQDRARVRAGVGQSRRPLPADRTRRGRRGGAEGGARSLAQRRGPALCAGSRPDPGEATRRRARRIARGRADLQPENARNVYVYAVALEFGRAQRRGAAGPRRRARSASARTGRS